MDPPWYSYSQFLKIAESSHDLWLNDRPWARNWAAETPNLLNVAVSRARRRLYVVGNREAWRTMKYFSILAELLPVWPPDHAARSVTWSA
jgi:hypothetical protein